MLKLTVTATGETTDELLLALEEAGRRVREDFTSGFDRNDTGAFEFCVTEADGEAPAADSERC